MSVSDLWLSLSIVYTFLLDTLLSPTIVVVAVVVHRPIRPISTTYLSPLSDLYNISPPLSATKSGLPKIPPITVRAAPRTTCIPSIQRWASQSREARRR